MTERPRVFIAYDRQDETRARELVQALERRGLDPWLDSQHLRAGDSWTEVIQQAVDESVAAVLILPSSHTASRWASYELTAIEKRGMPVVLVRFSDELEGGPFAELVQDRAVLDLRSDYDNRVDLLADRLKASAASGGSGSRRQHGPRAQLTQFGGISFSGVKAVPSIARPMLDPRFLRTVGGAPGGVPVWQLPEAFVGRSRELHEAEAALRDRAVAAIALTGTGGIGKTAFSIKLGQRAREEKLFEEVWFFTLRDYARASDFLSDLQRLGLESLGAGPSLQHQTGSPFRERSILLILDGVDEASWGDTEEVIEGLVGGAERGRSKVVLTGRRMPARLTGRPTVRQLALGSLDQAAAREVLIGLLGDDWNRFWDSAPAEIRDGNPLLMTLAATAWRQSGKSVDAEGRIGLRPLLETTLDQLPSRERQVLESLALLGEPSSLRTITSITPEADASEISSALESLSLKGLVADSDERWHVAHLLVKEAVIESAERAAAQSSAGTLFVTVDPSLINKEDIVELLATLNELYVEMGGGQLIIREDEIGRFSPAGVPV